VALVQVSSCAIEHVFSQVKYIRDTVGDKIYEDMMEIRMFAQCNGDLGDLVGTIYEDAV